MALPLYFDVLNGKDIDLPSHGKRIGSSELVKSLSGTNDEFIYENIDMLSNALYTAGTTGCISIENHTHDEATVEVVDGFRTLCSINRFFRGHYKTQQINNCCLIVIGGSIIEISEIHHILQHSYDTKKDVILIASGFSEDVANTLFVNWQQGKTKVIPFIIEDALESINELKDICTLTSTIPITKDTGIRISSLDLNDYDGKSVFYDAGHDALRIMLDHQSTKNALRNRANLQIQLQDERDDDVSDILSKRISRMSSRNVTVKTKFKEEERGLIQDRAAAFFMYFSKCAQQGVSRTGDDYPVVYLPYLETVNAIKRGMKDREAFGTIKAVLKIE
jgi:hypothetical protein